MKAKIYKDGQLAIMRGGKYKEMFCPFTVDNSGEYSPCGGWCPLFGEPVEEPNTRKRTSLSLCKKELIFDEFEDERV